ncbi:ras-related protein RabZ-like [Clytia hemisphaerica]|uniref:ras-related protein RabZ-like n=1 Tax=Clytia hemisphaerica TaxID=252671 RepID=UPI0034D3B049
MYPDGFERATEYYNVDISLNSKGISCKHELSVHDTPGNLRETFPHLYETVIRNSDTFILVFSLASSSGLSVIYRTLNDLKNIKGTNVPILIIANKADLESNAETDIKNRFKFYRDIATLNLPISEISLAQNADMKRHWIPLLVDFEERHDILRRRDPTIVVT